MDATLTVDGLDIPPEVGTLAGFRAWAASLGEGGPRVSFARGRVHLEMSPQDYRTHEPIVQAIGRALAAEAEAKGIGRWFAPPSWLTVEVADLSTEADGFLVRWDRLRSGEVTLSARRASELVGRPDLVVEVVSASSVRKDTVEHVEDYARARIPEYWIADGRGETPSLRILVLDGEAYAEQASDADGHVGSALFGEAFRLERFEDPAGWPAFRLVKRGG